MYDDVALFIKLVEVANYTNAASLLGITQATLSRRIKSLEDNLAVRLVKRDSRNFELTEQGEFLYQQMLVPIKKQQINLLDFINNKTITQGILKIALPAVLAYKLITPKLTQFTDLHPFVKLQITYTSTPIDLNKNNFNLALSTSLPLSQNSKVRLLTKYQFKLYTTPKYVHTYGTPEKLVDLMKHKIIGMITSSGSLNTAYNVINQITGEEELYTIEPAIYINNILHGIQILKSGKYIAGIIDGLIDEELKTKELIQIMPEYSFGEIPCYLIRPNYPATKLEQLFIDFIISCFEH